MKVFFIAVNHRGPIKDFTPLKRYEAHAYNPTNDSFYIYNDAGKYSYCLFDNCAHLDGGDWKQENDNNDDRIKYISERVRNKFANGFVPLEQIQEIVTFILVCDADMP